MTIAPPTPAENDHSGHQTKTVHWAPEALQGAVERAITAVNQGNPNGTCPVAWMDLAALVDIGNAYLAEPEAAR